MPLTLKQFEETMELLREASPEQLIRINTFTRNRHQALQREASTVAISKLAQGQKVRLNFPRSRKYHGAMGIIEKVKLTKVSVKLHSGLLLTCPASSLEVIA